MTTNKYMIFFSITMITSVYQQVSAHEENTTKTETIITNDSDNTELDATSIKQFFSFDNSLNDRKKEIFDSITTESENLIQNCKKRLENFSFDGIAGEPEAIDQISEYIKKNVMKKLSMSPHDKLEFDKIGAISATITAGAIATFKKKRSVLGKFCWPVFAGWTTYKLVATNKEVKQAFCDGVDFLKDRIK